MMDLAQLVQQITAALQPHLSTLLTAGETAAGTEGGKRIVSAIWEKLKGKPKVVEAAQELAEDPKDEDAQEIFARRIKKALKNDPELQAELTKLLSQAGSSLVQASGDRAVAIGGNASGNTIITGDNNVVGSGNTVHNVRADKIIGSAIGDGSKVINRWRDDD